MSSDLVRTRSTKSGPPQHAWWPLRSPASVAVVIFDRQRRSSTPNDNVSAPVSPQVEDNDDTWWKPDVRETDGEIAERGMKFLAWLATRPETEIAVVSHSSFLHFMLSNFATAAAPDVQRDLRRLFGAFLRRGVVHAAVCGCVNVAALLENSHADSIVTCC